MLEDVNLLQGTESHFGFSTGNTLPLVARPFGMTHWAPQTNEARGGWYFHPGDRKLEGIRATHQPSPWIGDYGWLVVMPQTGVLRPGSRERACAYRPEDAHFAPHHFAADLIGCDCRIEITPTERCAMLRCTFRADEAADPFGAALPRRLLLEPGRGEAYVEVDSGSRLIRGWTRSNNAGVPETFRLYFILECDRPPSAWGVFQGKDTRSQEIVAQGERAGGYLEFGPGAVTVEARIGTSFIGWEQARRNIDEEIRRRTFDEVREEGAAVWQETRGRLEVDGGTEEQRRTFYSCLYRTQLFPRDLHEPGPDGSPVHYSPFDGAIHPGRLVTDNGFWDTYRTVYPFLSLFDPDRLGRTLDGWLAAYRESGWLPTWASPGYRLCMVGTHADAVFADAIVKGVPGFDRELAYEAIRKHAFEVVEDDTGFGRLGLRDYMELGYAPDDRVHHASASRTLDYAYDDFCIAQVAEVLGREEDRDELLRRAENWRNVFDPSVRMMRGRNADGSWREPWDPYEWGGPFVEGGPWQHAWGVPHDPAGLIAAMGGPEPFVEKLEEMLTGAPRFRVGSYGFEIHEMTEMACAGFGQYAQSNQPVHHVLALFACAGRPDRMHYWVRRVMAELYSPDRFPGDEDNGEMAAWYLFQALGLYPLCPGRAAYILGVPLFPYARLTMAEGKQITIRAECEAGLTPSQAPYVQSITWNGEPCTRIWIAHADLAQGGELVFELTVAPPESV